MIEAELGYELLVVDDDSRDGTNELVNNLEAIYPARLIDRKGKVWDLSESVLDGIREAANDIVVVMDADLSHPPTAIPEMVKLLDEAEADFVIGSRYVSGGSFDREWNFWRFLNSWIATRLANWLTESSDPMSGFFALRKSEMAARSALKPIGYKIGLELMVRGDYKEIAEVPIRFIDRSNGQSKMNWRQQLNYLLHIRRLYLFKFPGRAEFLHFLAVGSSGFFIDVGCYLLLLLFGIEHRLARAMSFWPAVTSNWILNRTTTFSERTPRPRLKQWAEFVASSLFGFSINGGGYYLLTTHVEFFDRYRLLALLLGVGMGAIFNFFASSLFVYSEKRAS
jgi:dolichol-phosphate mannosyltransferase